MKTMRLEIKYIIMLFQDESIIYHFFGSQEEERVSLEKREEEGRRGTSCDKRA